MGNKAPGRSDRKGLSIVELFEIFPDELVARKWFEDSRWKHGRNCPHCGSMDTVARKNEKPLSYLCRSCQQDFSVKTETIMHCSKLSLRTWSIGIYMKTTCLKGVSSMELHRALGITQKTARIMSQKIRGSWDRSKRKLKGVVEVDETFLVVKKATNKLPKNSIRVVVQ